jgi:2-haloacid dehalogenase
MVTQMYKAIIFDLDNTLLNYTKSELESMQRTVQHHGLLDHKSLSWDGFWSRFNKFNTYYWNERNRLGYDIHQVLEYSFQDTLNELAVDFDSKKLAGTYPYPTTTMAQLT